MRLPWTLWVSMTIELWRLVLLTTAVLVAVIAFALAIKPLASGQLGPAEAIRFMLVAIPPMLSYALPFASCFGATLAYHRMVQDREVLAAHAAGMSHLRVLAPAIASGLVLAAALSLLNAQVIPRFVRTMQEMVADDLARVIVSRVEAGQPVERRDIILSAQTARLLDPAGMPGARSRLWLTGVRALLLDDQRMPAHELFAESAQVWILPGGQDRELGEVPGQVLIQVNNARGFAADGTEASMAMQTRSFPLPNAFRDDPQFLTTQELDALGATPERMNFIDWRRVDLAYHLAARLVLEQIGEDLGQGLSIRLEREDASVFVRGCRLVERIGGNEYALRPLGDMDRIEVEVRWQDAGGEQRLDGYAANRAVLRVDLGDDWRTRKLSLDLMLRNFAPIDLGGPGGTTTTRAQTEWTGLRLPSSPEKDLLALGSDDLLARAGQWLARSPQDGELAYVADALDKRVDELAREVTGTRHQRVAMAMSCLVMIVGGAIASLRLRTGQALVIYCWAFFPAIAALVTISAGQEMVHRSGLEWLGVLWGGVAGIAGLGVWGFRVIARH